MSGEETLALLPIAWDSETDDRRDVLSTINLTAPSPRRGALKRLGTHDTDDDRLAHWSCLFIFNRVLGGAHTCRMFKNMRFENIVVNRASTA